MINRFKSASKKVLLSVLIFLIFVYVTVLLCTIPTDFTINFENGKATPSHIGVLIIKDTNEKFISLLKLDLGRTGKDDRSLNYLVTSIMRDSLLLLAGGIILAVLLGVSKGIISEQSRYRDIQGRGRRYDKPCTASDYSSFDTSCLLHSKDNFNGDR